MASHALRLSVMFAGVMYECVLSAWQIHGFPAPLPWLSIYTASMQSER